MVVDIDRLDSDFKYEVMGEPGAENAAACFTCGQCTAGCPVSEVETRYNPRKIIRMIMWGMREELLSSDLIWLCNRCFTCYAHCPQDVRFTYIIDVLRRMAVREGYADASRLELMDAVDVSLQRVRRQLVDQLVAAADGVEAKDLSGHEAAAVAALVQELSADEDGEGSVCSDS